MGSGIRLNLVPTESIALICGSISLRKVPVTSTYGRAYRTYTIFEGTSEIQRLVISRAISGIRIQ